MGHRANLVVVEHGTAAVHDDHWAARDLSNHLVLGPEHALRWVRQQAMDALESLLGLPAGLLDPAIADHHPLCAAAEDVAVVVRHATELTSLHPTAPPRPAHRSGDGDG